MLAHPQSALGFWPENQSLNPHYNYGWPHQDPVLISTASKQPSRQQWEKCKETIIQYYADHSLAELMAFMERTYSFKATPRMYKQRFKEWNVYKYKKAEERNKSKLSSPVEQFETEPLSRTSTTYTVPLLPELGDNTDMDFFDSDMEHQNLDESIYPHQCFQSFIQSERDAVGFTYSPMFDNSSLSYSTDSGSMEEFIYHVIQFVNICRRPSEPHISPMPIDRVKITAGTPGHCAHRASPDQCERCTWAEFDYALAKLEGKNYIQAFESLNQGCSLARLLLQNPSKLFIRNLIMAFGSNRWEKFEGWRREILTHLANMSEVFLTSQHPITNILRQSARSDILKQAAERALETMIELFVNEHEMGVAHPDVLLLKRSLSIVLRRQQEYEISEDLLLDAIRDSKKYNGDVHKETRRCLRRLAHLYMEQKRWAEAEKVCETILNTAPAEINQFGNRTPDEISCYTYFHLSQIASSMGDNEKCRQWFFEELNAAFKRWGPQGEYSNECTRLAGACQNLGPETLRTIIERYPDIDGLLKELQIPGSFEITKARWCAVRNLI